MKKQIDNIYWKRFFYFNLYVIKGTDGDILIDTGFIFQKKAIKKWLDQFNIKLIILTHAHIDHIWNAAYLKEIYNCQIAISQNDIDYLDNTKIHSKTLFKSFYPFCFLMNIAMQKLKQKSFEIDIKLKDNQILDIYGNKIQVIALPGHTKGTIGLFYNDILFSGDAIVNRRKHIEPAYQNIDNKEAIKSVIKLINLKPKIVFVGHDNPVKQEKLIYSLEKIKTIQSKIQ